MNIGRLSVVLSGLTTSLLLSACGGDVDASGAGVLRFSAIPDQDETLLRAKYAPVAEWLSEQLGVQVEYVHASKYADSVDMFKNGDIQLAWFGGLTGVQARAAVPGARAIAQGEADPKFYSYFIANASTGLERSETLSKDIAGRKFTFGSADSTSGRLMPEYFIREHFGKSPKEVFGAELSFSGNHDKTCELVESGQFEVGAVNFKVYDRRVADGKTDPSKCRVIWKTPPYVDYNFTAHPSLDRTFGEGFTDKLQQALLAMTDERLLSAFPRKRLIAANNEDFAAVEKLAKELGFVR